MSPGLAHMAKDVLAAPISGVGVEHLFSTARQVCTFQHYLLQPNIVGKVMVLRHLAGALERFKVGIDNDNDGCAAGAEHSCRQ
jgi:hypothetical protein